MKRTNRLLRAAAGLALAALVSFSAGACARGTAAPAAGSAAAGKPAVVAAAPAPAAAQPAKPKVVAVRPASAPAFDHKSHIARGPACTDCHEGAEKADKAGLPKIEMCMECHEEIEPKAPPERKISNFVDAKTNEPLWNRFTRQAEYVRFSHKAHAAKQVPCADCHGKMEENVRTGPDLHLEMPSCVSCHEKKGATLDCVACHASIRKDAKPPNHDAKWQTAHGKAWRAGPAKGTGQDCLLCHTEEKCGQCHSSTIPASHAGKWIAAHGPLVKSAQSEGREENCAMCHKGTSCADCHRVTKPENHERLWNVRHGQIVRRGSFDGPAEDCSMCHRENSCISCHRDEKPRDHNVQWLVGPGHGLAAAFDRERCAACHREDSCTGCHTSNPPRSHTGSWGSPRNRHCLGCHETPGAEGGCFVCHKGLPAHARAPDKPKGHRPDWECLTCHDKLKHPVNGQNCNECHR